MRRAPVWLVRAARASDSGSAPSLIHARAGQARPETVPSALMAPVGPTRTSCACCSKRCRCRRQPQRGSRRPLWTGPDRITVNASSLDLASCATSTLWAAFAWRRPARFAGTVVAGATNAERVADHAGRLFARRQLSFIANSARAVGLGAGLPMSWITMPIVRGGNRRSSTERTLLHPLCRAHVDLSGSARRRTPRESAMYLEYVFVRATRSALLHPVLGISCGLLLALPLSAQQRADSVRRDSLGQRMAGVLVTAPRQPGGISIAPRITAGLLTTATKSEVVQVSGTTANVAQKVGRQLFAEVPGVFVYDMDGAGNQVNISARGLDAHRSWEFSVRQNGIATNSDVYGYPASHYSPPMEAIERVELVRGTAALEYGSQFGGMINYVVRTPDTTRAATLDLRSSAGSFGLVNTFAGVGGRIGRMTYYTYASARRSDGYRANDNSTSDAEYVSASAPLSPAWTLRGEVGRSRYLYRQPGPLTDAMFASDPRMATRSRNYYSPDIVVPSLSLTWTPRVGTRATIVASGVFGNRSSVAVGGFANQPDTAIGGVFSARQVDIDRYDTRTLELRVLHDLHIGSQPATLAAGIAVADNDMWRRQRGTGSRGSDWSLLLQPGSDFQRSLHYLTANVAAYGELEWRLSPRWTIVPGVRVEDGTTRMRGTLAYYDPANTPRNVQHKFPLFGLRSAYKFGIAGEWYGGASQAYRPQILKDLLPETATERTDPRIQDARGWTVESGVRQTHANGVSYDAGVFAMRYAHRFGILSLSDPDGTPYTFKTNVGTSETYGVETRLSVPFRGPGSVVWRAFSAASYMHARYVAGSVIAGGKNLSVVGNAVESAPDWIARGGLTATHKRVNATVLLSHVSRTFADALNTVTPSANGATGVVPSYTLVDVHGSIAITRLVRLSGGVSNLFDRQYFTKRPQFYPGPGVWPSDGSSVFLSLTLR